MYLGTRFESIEREEFMKQILFFILIHFTISAQAGKIDFNSLIAESEPLSKSNRVTLGQSSSEPGFFTENATPHEQEIKIKIRRRPTPKEVGEVRSQLRKKLERIKNEAAQRKLNDKNEKKKVPKDPMKISLVKIKKHVAGSARVKASEKKRAKEISQIRKSDLRKKISSHKKSKSRLEAKLDSKKSKSSRR